MHDRAACPAAAPSHVRLQGTASAVSNADPLPLCAAAPAPRRRSWTGDGTSCSDINECSTNSAALPRLLIAALGATVCTCTELGSHRRWRLGVAMQGCGNACCWGKRECSRLTGSCRQVPALPRPADGNCAEICVNTEGGHHCACTAGCAPALGSSPAGIVCAACCWLVGAGSGVRQLVTSIAGCLRAAGPADQQGCNLWPRLPVLAHRQEGYAARLLHAVTLEVALPPHPAGTRLPPTA